MKQFFKIFAISFVSFALIFTLGAKLYINSVFSRMVEDPDNGPIVSTPDNPNDNDGKTPDKPKDRVNIIIIGTDGERSDTIILASINTKTKKIDLLSIPRDTYYHRQGYELADQKKINAAYGIRGDYRDKSRSVALAASNVLGGIVIDYYIRLDYDAVRKIVDNIGGVSVDVIEDMKYEDPMQDLYIDIKAGFQTLNGNKALEFIRYREPIEADLGRMKRQQEFIVATAKKALTFSNIISVVETTSSYVRTNMSASDIQRFAKLAVGFDPTNINTHMLPGRPQKMFGADFFAHDPRATRELVERIYSKDNN